MSLGNLPPAVRLLHALEWDEHNDCCPICGGIRPLPRNAPHMKPVEGHAPGCEIARIINAKSRTRGAIHESMRWDGSDRWLCMDCGRDDFESHPTQCPCSTGMFPTEDHNDQPI